MANHDKKSGGQEACVAEAVRSAGPEGITRAGIEAKCLGIDPQKMTAILWSLRMNNVVEVKESGSGESSPLIYFLL